MFFKQIFKVVKVTIIIFFLILTKAEASLIINEILADPGAGISGDANKDGVTSSSHDEFIELFNPTNSTIDLSGWYLNDAVRTRHIFDSNTFLDPQQYLVIFSGGNPTFKDFLWFTASTGSLGLNNTGDTLSLYDGWSQIVNQVSYGSLANHNESIVRVREMAGAEFVRHSSLSNDSLYSPGFSAIEKISTVQTPEPFTVLSMLVGVTGMWFKRKKDGIF